MAKSYYIFFCVFILFCLSSYSLDSGCLITSLDRQLGVRSQEEITEVGKFLDILESTNTPEGNSWCSAYVHWNLEKCGIKNTITAWSPTSFNKKNIIWYQGKFKKTVKSGDVFSLYSLSKKRIAHTGFVRERLNEKFYITNEGNSIPDGWQGNQYEGFAVVKRFVALTQLTV